MSHRLFNIFSLIILVAVTTCTNPEKISAESTNITPKENGRIILAYKAFEDFLDSDRSWETYQKMVFDRFPEIKYLHARQISWGAIDSLHFPQDLKKYNKQELQHYFDQYNEKMLNDLNDTVIKKARQVLPPVDEKPVDLFLFFPYGSCLINPEADKSTIYISLYINPQDVKKIMLHEYAHDLHIQRRPKDSCRKRHIMRDTVSLKHV
ncbi:hypothetical protein JW935_13605 [candidate division KSB1 bacterium]|nr:hypothetical protein [candidate division KSB1 bacterium]